MSDTRIFFAAERTLLAWVRTGLTVMALGFVVARFGLFLRMIALSNPALANASALSSTHWPSEALGVILVLAGSAIILGALRNHRVYVSSLPVEDIPLLPIPQLASFLSLSVATAGILLAVYLIFA
jgi:putative membrane protein